FFLAYILAKYWGNKFYESVNFYKVNSLLKPHFYYLMEFNSDFFLKKIIEYDPKNKTISKTLNQDSLIFSKEKVENFKVKSLAKAMVREIFLQRQSQVTHQIIEILSYKEDRIKMTGFVGPIGIGKLSYEAISSSKSAVVILSILL